MAVPSSGPIQLYGDIWTSFNAPSQGENSLHSASIYAGFSTPDAMSDFYGFVDVVLATLTTNAMSSITTNSMRANGNLTDKGGGTITARGFYFGTSATAVNNTQYQVDTLDATGTFYRDFTGLSYQTYYAFAYATNEAGTSIASGVSGVPTLVTPSTFYQATMQRATCVGNQYHQWYSPQTGGFITNASLGYGCPLSGIHIGWTFAAGYQDRFLQSMQYPNSNNAWCFAVPTGTSRFTSVTFQGGGPSAQSTDSQLRLNENGSATHYTN